MNLLHQKQSLITSRTVRCHRAHLPASTKCCTAGGQGRAPATPGSWGAVVPQPVFTPRLCPAQLCTTPRPHHHAIMAGKSKPGPEEPSFPKHRWQVLRERCGLGSGSELGRHFSWHGARIHPAQQKKSIVPTPCQPGLSNSHPQTTHQPCQERAIPLVLQPVWLGDLEWGEV